MVGLFIIPLLTISLGELPFRYAAAEAELSEEIHTRELMAHVYRLASPEFLGRRGAGAARAARHLASSFQRLKLLPAFGGSYFQPIPSILAQRRGDNASFAGRNIGAILPGTDPSCEGQWVFAGAHYDHLGTIDGQMFPGADDDASGVAAVLEVAESFALRKIKTRRTIVFVLFDQEEAGLIGSRHFAAHPPFELTKLQACLTADMIGRSMANLMDEYVFVLGSENSRRLRRLVEEVHPEKGLKVGRIGTDLIGDRSDYGPFRERRIPFLFFSTGQHPDYHQPSDLPDRVDFEKLRKIAVWIAEVTGRLANDQEQPIWDDKGLPPDLDEFRTVHTLVGRILGHPTVFPLTEKQRELVGGVKRRLDEILERAQATSTERTWLLWTARLLMVTMF